MNQRGEVVQWNDERGFGFVAGADGMRYFLHISEMRRGSRRPEAGDMVRFVPARAADSRVQAVAVHLVGETPTPQPPRVATARPAKGREWRLPIAVLMAGLLGWDVLSGALPFWVILVYGGLGVMSFVTYALDKFAAESGHWRIRESQLHLVDFCGGIVGGLCAQAWFRHKTRKDSFVFATLLIVCLHMGLLGALAMGVVGAGGLSGLGLF